MEDLAVQVKHLNHAFQDKKVLEDISLALERDKIYGLLGKNGAGKTTLINLLVNQLIAKEGEIKIFGKDPRKETEVLEKVCVIREGEFYAPYMKVKAIFELYRRFFPLYDKGLEQKLVELFELPVNKPYQKYSRGMKTLVFNIIGLCTHAELTLFDEPTLGLDAVNREQFYTILLEEYAKNPRTIILSTHLIDEVENLLERVVIINQGKIMLHEEVEEFKAKGYYLTGCQEAFEGIKALESKQLKESFGKTYVYSYFGTLTNEDKEMIRKANIEVAPMGLQKAFVELTRGKEPEYERINKNI